MTAAQRKKLELEDVTARSRHCPYCQGVGRARVYSPTYKGEPLETIEVLRRGEVVKCRVPAAVNAHCLCPLGRWTRAHQTSADVLARTPDLADVLAGRSRWLAQDPTKQEDVPPWPAGRDRGAR